MEILEKLLPKIAGDLLSSAESSFEGPEPPKRNISFANVLSDDGINCELCGNVGYVSVVVDGYEMMQPCTCLEVRRSNRRLKQAGVNKDYVLENFVVESDWQKAMLTKAHNFLANPDGWFYLGGQVGCGKSLVCTGIVRKLIEQGKSARYMRWRDDSTTIKASIKYPEDYAALVEPLKTVEVLYIDDFFKTNSGEPTTADANLAFEILNSRYNNSALITIISSEFYLTELVDIDQAIGSRIYERAKKHSLNIGRDKTKNYRMKDTEFV